MANNIVVGIDIGSHSIYTVVAQKKEDLLPQIIGIGFARALGIRKGVIVDIEDAAASISESIQSAERMAGIKVDRAVVSIGGAHVYSNQSRGVVAVSRADSEISSEDIERVMLAAQTFSLPNNREILHVIPREFLVDGEGNIKDPLGMKGVRLEAEALIINGASPYIRNLARCLGDIGVNIDSIVLDTLAASKAVLTKRQKELGSVCVDIGGGTTGIAVYEEGDLLHTSTVPLGSSHITNDIAIGLRVPVDIAESMKIEYGSAIASEVPKKDMVDLSYIDSQEKGSVSRRELCDIIEARLSEIFDLINKELKKIGKEAFLPGGVILVGGGAKTPNIIDFAKEKMRLPAQIGFPREVEGIVERVDDPLYATALGLIFWGLESMEIEREGFVPNIPSLNNSVKQLKRWIKALLP